MNEVLQVSLRTILDVDFLYFQGLRDFLMSRLLTTPVEDVEKSRFLREITEKEKYNAGIIAKLSSELKIVEEQRDAEVTAHVELELLGC